MPIKKSIYLKEYRLLLMQLKNRRRALKVFQEDLSKRLGKSETFVSKVERAERRLDILELISYLRELELDPKKFLCDFIDQIDASNDNI